MLADHPLRHSLLIILNNLAMMGYHPTSRPSFSYFAAAMTESALRQEETLAISPKGDNPALYC